jgi:hypothetical protein
MATMAALPRSSIRTVAAAPSASSLSRRRASAWSVNQLSMPQDTPNPSLSHAR